MTRPPVFFRFLQMYRGVYRIADLGCERLIPFIIRAYRTRVDQFENKGGVGGIAQHQLDRQAVRSVAGGYRCIHIYGIPFTAAGCIRIVCAVNIVQDFTGYNLIIEDPANSVTG